MRVIEGKTDRVVIVGAGLSGLSAALYLAGRGREVTVVERGGVPGGRVGRADISGYRLDTGPTVLTMPDIIDDALSAVGEKLTDRLELLPVHPAYRAMFADGAALDVHTEADAMFAEIQRFAGGREADAYLRLRAWLTQLYQTEFDGFIGANFDSPLSLLTPQLARLVALGGFRRWENVIRRFLTDERLLRVFTFQALYAGVPPQSALAVYAVIAYMDTIAGVYFPRGGMRALPDAMAAAAADAGVEFIYDSKVSELECSGSRVTAVCTHTGQRIAADTVVLTTELPDTYRLLGHTPRRLLKLRPAPSAVVAHVGCRAVDQEIGHHTIVFGDAWKQTFGDIIDHGRVMRDPSLLVTRPTASDPSLAPPGRDLLYVLAPAPNTEVGQVDWDATGSAYVDEMLGAVTARLPQLGDDLELLHLVTPA
ncbi:MAG: phytoene desaturase family protein, partial [Mycobacterium sp.]